MTILMRMADLWQYRETTLNLVLRDLKVRYKNSFLGVLWSLINPLLMTAVFTVVFTVMMPNSFVENFPVFCAASFLGTSSPPPSWVPRRASWATPTL